MEKIIQFFSDKKVHSVLDVGCGGGDFIQILHTVFGSETQITGIDPYEEALQNARKRFNSANISFIQMEGEKMEFADEQFDVVSISFALHHLADVSKTLSEMKRVVKPDGWLIINEITSETQNQAQENQKYLHHLKSFADQLNGIPHRETYSPAEILSIISENNIQVIDSFMNLKNPVPIFDPKIFEERLQQMADSYEQMKGHVRYAEKEQALNEFKQQLDKHGLQIAPSLLVIGKK